MVDGEPSTSSLLGIRVGGKGLAREQMTIIISTHRFSLLSYVDRLLLFEKGRLVADGPRDKILAMLQGGPKRFSESTEPA